MLKIMSKMGISVLASYRGAQIFEAIGLDSKLVEKCFTGTSTQIEGVRFHEIAEESLRRHALAYAAPADGAEKKAPALQNPGLLPVPAVGRGARGDAADDQEFPHLRADRTSRRITRNTSPAS